MLCQHSSIRSKTTGNRDACLQCKLDIIFDGKKWVWLLSIGADKRRKLERIYAIDQVVSRHI